MEVVSEYVKKARENALVGNYSESEDSYAAALRTSTEFVKHIYEPDKKLIWREVCDVVFLSREVFIQWSYIGYNYLTLVMCGFVSSLCFCNP